VNGSCVMTSDEKRLTLNLTTITTFELNYATLCIGKE
jgi:hypothetical protein